MDLQALQDAVRAADPQVTHPRRKPLLLSQNVASQAGQYLAHRAPLGGCVSLGLLCAAGGFGVFCTVPTFCSPRHMTQLACLAGEGSGQTDHHRRRADSRSGSWRVWEGQAGRQSVRWRRFGHSQRHRSGPSARLRRTGRGSYGAGHFSQSGDCGGRPMSRPGPPLVHRAVSQTLQHQATQQDAPAAQQAAN